MRVLISNDDGVFADGINILAKELSDFVDIEVVAPDRNRSGASNSLTLTQPIKVKKLENGYYSVEGTPTDCVHLALTGFLNLEIDMVVSGINDGANLGDDILYSGTVAAAMEGCFLGIPAIAISLAFTDSSPRYYITASEVAKKLALQIHQSLSGIELVQQRKQFGCEAWAQWVSPKISLGLVEDGQVFTVEQVRLRV